jgi:hypothetical protein
MAAALRSGVPQVPCPVMLDQPHNAATVVRLGCAPGVLPFSNLSARKLAPLVTATLATTRNDNGENRYVRCAKVCGEQIRRESVDVMDKYINIIESYTAEQANLRGSRIKGRHDSDTSSSSNGGMINYSNPTSAVNIPTRCQIQACRLQCCVIVIFIINPATQQGSCLWPIQYVRYGHCDHIIL